MDAVLGVLSTIGGIFRSISGVFSGIMEILTGFGTYIFLAGFIGLLLAFLLFIFRYLDKKRLTLPIVLFALFFVMFLGGNLLLLANEAKSIESAVQAIGTEVETSETPGGEDIRI